MENAIAVVRSLSIYSDATNILVSDQYFKKCDCKMFVGFLREFDPLANDWTVFKKQLENFFLANNITNSNEKRALFLNTLNEECYKVLMTWCHPVPPESTPFNTLLLMFDQQFAECVFMNRFKFFNARRAEEENIEEWAARVRVLAESCQFGPESDACLRDKFIIGLGNYSIFLLFEDNADVSFDEAVEIVLRNQELEAKKISKNYYDFNQVHGWPSRVDYSSALLQHSTFPVYE